MKVLTRSGAFGYITRFDPDLRFPFVVHVPEQAADAYECKQDFSVQINGSYYDAMGKRPEDVTHFIEGKTKFPFYNSLTS